MSVAFSISKLQKNGHYQLNIGFYVKYRSDLESAPRIRQLSQISIKSVQK